MSQRSYLKDAYYIPIKVLRELVSNISSKRKKEYIEELDKKNSERLKKLSMHYTTNREKSFYLYKCPDSLKFDSALEKLKHLETRKMLQDVIYDTKSVIADEDKLEITLKMRIHSERKKLTAEDAETLSPFSKEYRRAVTTYIVFHIEDKVLEIKTKSNEKATLCSEFLSHKLFGKGQQFERYQNCKLKKNAENLIYKRVVFRGLNFAGAEEIAIKGEDVMQTTAALKERKVDLEQMASETLKNKGEAGRLFRLYQDGRVVYRAKLENAYYQFKELFLFG